VRARLPIIGTALVTALVVAPLAALAATSFRDVDPGSVHAPGIDFLVDNGVTQGCGDGSRFCPNDAVTRAQMATFMQRLATSGAVVPDTAAVEDIVADLTGAIVAQATAAAAQAAATAPGAVVAQGLISADGIRFFQRGIAGVTKPSPGEFCIALDPALGLGRNGVYAQVTPEYGQSLGTDLLAYYRASGGSCPGQQLQVLTFDATGSLSDDVGFVITVFRR
jgi:hypothetical protein